MKKIKIATIAVLALTFFAACEEMDFEDEVMLASNDPNFVPATYNSPAEEEEPGIVAIDTNRDGTAYMVLDSEGYVISIGKGSKEMELSPGQYYVVPDKVKGYFAPVTIVEVESGNEEEVEIEYREEEAKGSGTLFIDLIPPFSAYYIVNNSWEVVAVGFDSDEFSLPPGTYFVVPEKLEGFKEPKMKRVEVENEGVHIIEMRYLPLDFDLQKKLDETMYASL